MISSFLPLLCVLAYTTEVSLAGPIFVHFPPPTVYFIDEIDVNCTTSTTAKIDWFQISSSMTIRLPSSTYGIRNESDTVSRMKLSGNALKAVTLDLATNDFICRALEFIEATNSSQFGFTTGKSPSLGLRPRNATLVEGSEANFQCSSSRGSPKPTISWTFTSQLTGKQVPVGVASDQSGDNPYKAKIDRHDAGVYTCHASNQFGTESAPATLTVEYSTQAKLEFEPSISVTSGTDVNAICTLESVPMADSVQLLRDEKPLSLLPPIITQVSFNTSTFTFKIKAGNSSSNYSCQPNGHVQSESVQLTVIEPPSRPVITDKTLPEICWKQGSDGNSPIQNSTLSCSTQVQSKPGCPRNELPEIRYIVTDRSTTHCTIPTNLIPGTTHKCYAFATNDYFNGHTSAEFEIMTPVGKPGTVTQSVIKLTNETLIVRVCMSYTGGYNQISKPVIKPESTSVFSVIYNLTRLQDSSTLEETNFTISNLVPNTMYSVTVTLVYPGGSVTSKSEVYRTRLTGELPTMDGQQLTTEAPGATLKTKSNVVTIAAGISVLLGIGATTTITIIIIVIVKKTKKENDENQSQKNENKDQQQTFFDFKLPDPKTTTA